MAFRKTGFARMLVLAYVTLAMLVLTCCTKRSNAQTSAAELTFDTKGPFQFIVYGDTRFL